MSLPSRQWGESETVYLQEWRTYTRWELDSCWSQEHSRILVSIFLETYISQLLVDICLWTYTLTLVFKFKYLFLFSFLEKWFSLFCIICKLGCDLYLSTRVSYWCKSVFTSCFIFHYEKLTMYWDCFSCCVTTTRLYSVKETYNKLQTNTGIKT